YDAVNRKTPQEFYDAGGDPEGTEQTYFHGVALDTYKSVIFANEQCEDLRKRKAEFDSEMITLDAPSLTDGVTLGTQEYGDEVWDMVSFIQGEDECMLDMRFDVAATPHVRLLFDISATANVEESGMIARAKAFLALVDALQKSGTAVTLDVAFTSCYFKEDKPGKRYNAVHIVNVLKSTEQADMRKMFYILGCREGLRRMMFKLQETCYHETDKMLEDAKVKVGDRESYWQRRGSGNRGWMSDVNLSDRYDMSVCTTMTRNNHGHEMAANLINRARQLRLIA
ncbi:MAG: hypothetical protein EB075_12720, partial [Bacteroidetes bacterium]|nr:hypothetical protein [Bacteroidota bacterium]